MTNLTPPPARHIDHALIYCKDCGTEIAVNNLQLMRKRCKNCSAIYNKAYQRKYQREYQREVRKRNKKINPIGWKRIHGTDLFVPRNRKTK